MKLDPNTFLDDMAKGLGRPLTDVESLAAVAALYLQQRNDLLELIGEARQAIDWYMGLCNSFERGETYLNYPDPDAYSYLKLEAWNIGERIDSVIAAAKGEPPVPEPAYTCEECGADVGDAKNLHRALAHDNVVYHVCDDCAHQRHRWQEVSS